MATELPWTGTVYKKPSIVIDSSGDVWTLLKVYSSTYHMLLYKNATQMEYVADDDIHGSGETMYWNTMCIDDSDVIHIFCVAAPGGATRDVAYATYTISTSTLSSWVEIYSYKTAYTSEDISCCINGAGDLFLMFGYNPKNPSAFMLTNESSSWVEYELGGDIKNRVYISCGIGLDGNDDVWLWYYSSTSPSQWCYRIWDSSASTLGSETAWTAELSPVSVYECRPGEGIWDGTNMRYWYHPYATSSAEDIIKEQVGSTAPVDISGLTIDRYYLYLSYSGNDFCFNYIDDTWKYIGAYYGFEGISLWHEVDGTWEKQTDLRDVEVADYETHWIRMVTANTSPAANFGNDLHYCYRHYVDGSGWRMFIDVIYPGTPASTNHKAFTFGGGTPSDSQSAFMTGRERYGSKPAFVDGHYDEGLGGETRAAKHAYVPTKPPSISAFLEGDMKFYFDVVPFNCDTGTGTQDIIGSLGGLEPSLAFFCGGGTTADDVMTANARHFMGMTDGVAQLIFRAYQLDASGSSSAPNGGLSTSACAGSSYGSGGSAAFEQWLTNGVQINWSIGAATAWDAAALLIACENPDGIKTASGSFDPPETAETGDKIQVFGTGFVPDVIITMVSQGGCGHGVGIAGYGKDGIWERGGCLKAWNTGPFNWPSSASISTSEGWFNIGDADDAGADNVGRWATNEPINENLFEFECYGSDGVYDLYTVQWFAFKLEPPGKAIFEYVGYSSSGSEDIQVNMNVDAVMGVSLDSGHDINAPSHYGGFGSSMFDGVHQFSNNSSCITGGSPWTAKCVGDTTKIGCSITQRDGPTQNGTVDFTTWLPGGWRVNKTVTPTPRSYNWYAIFGSNYPIKSRQKAFMYGTAHYVWCHTWGQAHPTSSMSAFFNVVDAQDFRHAYMQGLDPSRTSTPAMTMGFDDPMIIPVEFTLDNASGTFDITDPILNGNTPKAAMFFLFGAPEHDAEGYSEDAMISVGFTDGVNQYTRAARAKDDTGGDAFDQSQSWSQDSVMVVPVGTIAETRIAEATFSSWIADGVRVSWDNAPGDTFVGVCILFYGSEIEVYTNRLDRPGTIPADQAIATVGFEPDIMFMFSVDAYEDESSDFDESASQTIGLNYAINDNRSPTPSQGSLFVFTSGDGSWSMGAEPEQYVHQWQTSTINNNRWGGDTTWLKSFDSLGFTLRYNKDYAPGADYDVQYICFKIGGNRKFAWSAQRDPDGLFPGADGNTYDFVRKPYGDFHIIPEMLLIVPTFGYAQWSNYSGDDRWSSGSKGAGLWLAFWGNGVKRWYQNQVDEIFWDYYVQHKDQLVHARTVSDPDLTVERRDHKIPHELHTMFEANYEVIRDGIRTTTVSYDEDYEADQGWWPNTPWDCPSLIYGIAEWVTNISAFCHGERADWPSRTPRGCYLEGAVSLQTSSTPAFMQVGESSFMPCYLDGFIEGKSINAAFLHGVDTDLDDQWAFLWGKVFILDEINAYLVGQDTGVENQEAFLWGVDTDLDKISAFSAGGWNVDDAISAYTQSGWDVLDNQAAYLAGTEFTSSTFAYTEGFSATPDSNISAFTSGGGPWPFADDFTGSDEDLWDTGKWISTEEL